MHTDMILKKKLKKTEKINGKIQLDQYGTKKPLSIKEITMTDSNELLKRYSLLQASKDAGNTNINDEMIDTANKLYERKSIR